MLVICFVLPSLASAQIVSRQKQAEVTQNITQIPWTMTFSEKNFIIDTTQGYTRITLPDGDYLNEPGKPMLPAKQIHFAVPAGMIVTQVQVVDVQSISLSLKAPIYPAQPPQRLNGLDDKTSFVKPDPYIYYSSKPFPGKLVSLVSQTDLAGQGMAVIQLYPIQYIPSEKRLLLYTSITFVISGVDGYVCGDYLPSMISENGKRTYEQMVKEMVVNPEDVALQTASGPVVHQFVTLPPGQYDHIIITSSSYESYYSSLVNWHMKRGLRDNVVTTSWISSNYGGSSATHIRSFIIDAHDQWGTYYFLLGGEHSTVPFYYYTYYDESTPSDQYYSDYNGDWTHEVFVGRTTAQGSTEINRFIAKVLQYEKTPPTTGYPLDVLLIGMDLSIPPDTPTYGEDLKDTIDGYIPSQFVLTKVYDSDPSPPHNHRDDTIAALNAGQNLVNHADHGYYNYMGTGDRNHDWGIVNSDVDALTNTGQLSIVVSLACDANGMDYSSYDSISEHFVVYNDNKAGVAFTGNTRSGWGYLGSPASLSGQLDRDWWRGVFNYNQDTLGKAIIWSKHQFSTGGSDPTLKQHCEWTFNLLGEPAMPIWNNTPSSFTVAYPATLPLGSSSFTVHVTSGGTPVNQAYVCLWKGDEVYLRNYTNSTGDFTFTPSPSTLGTMYVTVTKHNYLPYEGSADVVGNIAPTVLNLYPSASNVYRTQTVTILSNAQDDNDPESALLCEMEYRAPSGTWTTLSGETFVADHLEASFTPATTAELGLYDFRVRYRDLDLQWCNWYEVDDMVNVINNDPVISPACDNFVVVVNKTANFDLTVFESDVEDSGTDLIWYEDDYTVDPSLFISIDVDPVTDIMTVIPQPGVYGSDDIDLWLEDRDYGYGWKVDVTITIAKQFTLTQELGHNYSQCVAVGDLDNDGSNDLAISIIQPNGTDPTQIYHNNGDGSFTFQQLLCGPSFYTYTNLFGDINRDGFLDLMTVGGWQCANPGKVWLNDGTGGFLPGQELDPTYTKGAVLGDIENDGDVDLITSYKIYRNDGTGAFIGEECTALGYYIRAVGLGDVNNDGTLDLIAGREGGIKICLNDGTGHFIVTAQNLGNNDTHDLALADIDADGDLDLIAANERYAVNEPTRVYLNNGTGFFTDTGQQIGHSPAWSLATGDIDNDGDLDLVIGNNYGYANELYLNDGIGYFHVYQRFSAQGTMDIALADIDNDNDLDLIAPNYFNASDAVYVNNEASINSIPNAPSMLTSTPSGVSVTLNWNSGSDDRTPINILTYRLRVGTSPGANNIVSGITQVGPGPIGHHLSFTLHTLTPGTYYWSVQTTDGSYAVSDWAPEQVFTIN